MIKPLRRFITATPLGALMSLTLQHPLHYPSYSISNMDAPSVLLLCGVCYWSWVNKWVFRGPALQIDLLAQTIYSCSALTKWLSLHWSIDTACHLRSAWFFFFPFLEHLANARPIAGALESSQGWTSVQCVFADFETFSPWFCVLQENLLTFIHYYCYQKMIAPFF